MFKGALPGFRDFYPQELAERAYIMNTWREVARRYAFVEYDGPPLEPLELYTRKSGDEIVGQLYSFVDKGDREVALRPEMTPTVARMVAARANSLRKPVRWFSMPQLFRYERQQKGRLREHYQLNVDIFGEADVSADAELLAVAIDTLRGYELDEFDFVARVSDRRILEAYLLSLGVEEKAIQPIYGIIDKLEKSPQDVSVAKLLALSVPPNAVERILRINKATIQDVSESLTNFRVTGAVGDFHKFLRYLAGLGVSNYVRFDLSIVRGLAYYTGIVFELFDTKNEFRAIAGGGRYDNLLASLGGVDLPALGFGMGDVVLGDLLRARGKMPEGRALVPGPDFWVATEGEGTGETTRIVATMLRRAGASVEYSLRKQSISKQKRAALSNLASHVVTVPEAFTKDQRVKIDSYFDLAGALDDGKSLIELLGGRDIVELDELVEVLRANPMLLDSGP